jgi:MYXO-CTERM domain-containing protein
VSCSGGCTCTPIPGFDAGTPDVVVPPDATGVDVQPGMDVLPGMDVQPGMDVPPGTDVQAADVVSCPNGVVVDGVCYSTPCTYQNEIGFVCSMAGYSCRTISGNAWCIPVCAGTTCPADQYCDPTFGCSSIPDGGVNCASLHCASNEVCDPTLGCVANSCGAPCPSGTTCVSGTCVSAPDGSADGAARGDGSADGGNGNHRGACGCRTPGGNGSSTGFPALLLAMGAIALVRRRR